MSRSLAEGAGLLGGAEECCYQHLAPFGLDGDQGRLSPLVTYEVEGKRYLPRSLGSFDRDIARVKEAGPAPRDHEHVIFPRRREYPDRGLLRNVPPLLVYQPVEGRAGQLIQGQLPVVPVHASYPTTGSICHSCALKCTRFGIALSAVSRNRHRSGLSSCPILPRRRDCRTTDAVRSLRRSS